MAKMRVHELAKELGIENKQIIEFLSTTEYAVKSHSSSVEDNVQALVRGKFGKGAAKEAPQAKADTQVNAAPAKAEASAKAEAPAKAVPDAASKQNADAKPAVKTDGAAAKQQRTEGADGRAERPKKKSSITAVFNAQYSKHIQQYYIIIKLAKRLDPYYSNH